MEGIAQSKDEFYGQYAPDNMLNSDRSHQRWEAWEKSMVYGIGGGNSSNIYCTVVRGVRAGANMAYGKMNNHTIELACDAIKLLIEEDKEYKCS